MTSSRKSRKINIFDYFLGLYCFFPFSLSPLRSLQVLIIYSFCLIYLLFNSKVVIRLFLSLNKFIHASLLLFLLFASFIFFIPAISKSFDLTYISFCTSILRSILLILSLVVYLKKNRKSLSFFDSLFFIIRIVTLYVLFTFLLLVPQLRDFWKSIIYMNETNANAAESIVYYTRFGLQGFSGFGHTVICTISILFFWVLKISKKEISFLYYIILLIGCFCYGRIGSIVSIFVSLYFSFIALKYNQRKYFFIIILFLTSFLLFLLYYISISHEYGFMSWILEPFINIISGKFTTASSRHLKSMYIFDFDLLQLFFGHGKYSNPDQSYYMYTDVGFLRIMYFGGLLLLSVYYLIHVLYFWGFCLFFKGSKKYVIFLALVGVSSVFELKGESIYIVLRIILFVSLLSFFKKNEVNNDKKAVSIYNKSI